MTRLDLIEHQAPDIAVQPLRDDILALVAVARAATQGPCRHDTSHRGETCYLCAALAPLLEETGPRQENAL